MGQMTEPTVSTHWRK